MSDITFEFEPDPGDDITFNIGEGQEGPPGQGVPVGGTDGQVLTKASATNYDTAWEDPAGGGAVGEGDPIDLSGDTWPLTLDLSTGAFEVPSSQQGVRVWLPATTGVDPGDLQLAITAPDAATRGDLYVALQSDDTTQGFSFYFTSGGATIAVPSGQSETRVTVSPVAHDPGVIQWRVFSLYPAGGAVDSVNGYTGTVVLGTSDVEPSTDRNYVTDAQLAVIEDTSGENTGDQDLSGLAPLTTTVAALGTTTGTVNLDLDAVNGTYQTHAITGNITYTSSNRASGKSVTVKVLCDATPRTFTFPSWVFLGTAPTGIAAGKTGILTVTWFGTADTDAVAAWNVQS